MLPLSDRAPIPPRIPPRPVLPIAPRPIIPRGGPPPLPLAGLPSFGFFSSTFSRWSPLKSKGWKCKLNFSCFEIFCIHCPCTFLKGKTPTKIPIPPKHIYVVRILKCLYLHVSNLYFYYIKHVIVYQLGHKEGGLVNKEEKGLTRILKISPTGVGLSNTTNPKFCWIISKDLREQQNKECIMKRCVNSTTDLLTGTLPGTLLAFILTSTTLPNSEDRQTNRINAWV